LYVLDHLNPDDGFNVVAFSSGVRTFSEEIEPASSREDGKEFVEGLEAMGGTDIDRALLEAAKTADPDRLTTVIFLTDGLATVGVEDAETILENVAEAAPEAVRIFSFGVGDDVDTDLLDQLSIDHGGASTYVRPGQKINETVTAFYTKIDSPVLSNPDVDFGSIKTDQIYPEMVPDLFAGSQLVMVGRYRNGGKTTITLSGTVNEREVSIIYPGNNFIEDGGAEFIPRLWATRAIGSYLTEIRLHGEDQELVDAIVTLSIRYGIITPYTSFLIEEGDVFSESGREAVSRKLKEDLAADAAAPSFGASAVEKASFQGEMATADAPLANFFTKSPTTGADEDGSTPEESEAEEVAKHVGSKTFLLRNGVWTDTVFDDSKMEPVFVEFLSEEYFDLIRDSPALGDYFALGERVIVVYDGTAYEVGER